MSSLVQIMQKYLILPPFITPPLLKLTMLKLSHRYQFEVHIHQYLFVKKTKKQKKQKKQPMLVVNKRGTWEQ
jgi:hypothetical protein